MGSLLETVSSDLLCLCLQRKPFFFPMQYLSKQTGKQTIDTRQMFCPACPKTLILWNNQRKVRATSLSMLSRSSLHSVYRGMVSDMLGCRFRRDGPGCSSSWLDPAASSCWLFEVPLWDTTLDTWTLWTKPAGHSHRHKGGIYFIPSIASVVQVQPL